MNGGEDATTKRIQKRRNRLKAGDVKEFISCSVCRGFLQSAVTITTCVHSFCRDCLMNHMRKSKACPKCFRMIHPLRPMINIRSDRTLQRLVYKMLPILFDRELERRRNLSANTAVGQEGLVSRIRTARQFDERLAIFSGKENFSISLHLRASFSVRFPDTENGQMNLGPRYLSCPSSVTIAILRRFIADKLNLGEKLEVNIFFSDDVLAGDYKLFDVAYIYGWTQVEPLSLGYSIMELSSYDMLIASSSKAVTKLVPDSNAYTANSTSATSEARTWMFSPPAPSNVAYSTARISSTVETSTCLGIGTVNECSASKPRRGRKRKKRRQPSESPQNKRVCARNEMEESLPNPCHSSSEMMETVSPNDDVPCSAVSEDRAIGAQVVDATNDKAENMVHTSDPNEVGVPVTMAASADQISFILREHGSTTNDLNQGHTTGMVSDFDRSINRNNTKTDSFGTADGEISASEASGRPEKLQASSAGPGATLSSVGRSDLRARPVDDGERASDHLNTQDAAVHPPAGTINGSRDTVHIGARSLADSYQMGARLDAGEKQLSDTHVIEMDCSSRSVGDGDHDITRDSMVQSCRDKSTCGIAEPVVGGTPDQDPMVKGVCPKCGRRSNGVNDASFSSRSCGSCLSISTSITVFINHRKLPEERPGVIVQSRKSPKDCLPSMPSIPKFLQNHEETTEFSANLIPKQEILDEADVPSTGLESRLHGTRARLQSFKTSVDGRCCQAPSDPSDLSSLQTKPSCQSLLGHDMSGHGNGSPSRTDPAVSIGSSVATPLPAVTRTIMPGSSTDRCQAAASSMTGNKYGRKHKSLETIIRSLQPRQMAPHEESGNGGCSAMPSPQTTARPPVGSRDPDTRSPFSPETRTTSYKFLPSTEDLQKLRTSTARQREVQTPSIGPQSILRKALTSTYRNGKYDYKLGSSREGQEMRVTAASSVLQFSSSVATPPIKSLSSMFEGLDSGNQGGLLHVAGGPKSENICRASSSTPMTLGPLTGLTSSRKMGNAFNTSTLMAETGYTNSQSPVSTKRNPAIVTTPGNGFDAPLELTTKESRDRKLRQINTKSEADVLRTSFPLFHNR